MRRAPWFTLGATLGFTLGLWLGLETGELFGFVKVRETAKATGEMFYELEDLIEVSNAVAKAQDAVTDGLSDEDERTLAQWAEANGLR